MLKTLRLLVITASVGTVVVVGCGNDDNSTGTNLPPRNSGDKDGGQTNTSSSGGSSGTTDPNYDCSNHAPVDDDPECDKCARDKCCEWITKCDGSPSCKATQDCLAACADNDTACILTCGTGGGTGGVFLQEFGACVANGCKNECDYTPPDGGVDAF